MTGCCFAPCTSAQAMKWVKEAFSLRPAVRIDHSSQPVFETKDGSLKRSNLTALVELVYLF